MLARLEARILPRIEAAAERERERERNRFPVPVVAKVATAPDPRAVWESLPPGRQTRVPAGHDARRGAPGAFPLGAGRASAPDQAGLTR